MERRLEPLKIRTLQDQGEIVLEQQQGQEDVGIFLTPEQVPIVVKWLEEAAAEIVNSKPTPTE